MADIIICPYFVSMHNERGKLKSVITCLPLIDNSGFDVKEQRRFGSNEDMRAYLDMYCKDFGYEDCPVYKARMSAGQEVERMKTLSKKLKAANGQIKNLEGFLDLERKRNHERNVEIARLKKQLEIAKGDLANVGGAIAARVGDEIVLTSEELQNAPRYAAAARDGKLILKRV